MRFEDPESAPYDRFAPKLNKHATALLVEWSTEVLFAGYKKYTVTDEKGFNQKRVRGVGTGERIIRTTERPGWVAKNRLGLPDEIQMPKEGGWAVFSSFFQKKSDDQSEGNVNVTVAKKATKQEAVTRG
jgi:hypothetical protein